MGSGGKWGYRVGWAGDWGGGGGLEWKGGVGALGCKVVGVGFVTPDTNITKNQDRFF